MCIYIIYVYVHAPLCSAIADPVWLAGGHWRLRNGAVGAAGSSEARLVQALGLAKKAA